MSESKGETKQSSFLEIVQDFCMSSQLENEFEAFAIENAEDFLVSTDLKEGDEHPLRFHDVYQKYLDKFERRIERFIVQVVICAFH